MLCLPAHLCVSTAASRGQAPHGNASLRPFHARLPGCPFLSLALPLPVPFPFLVWWWWGAGGVCVDCSRLGVGGLAPLAEGLGGVGGAEALDRVPEEGIPWRLRHDGLRGGLVGVGGGAGADLLEGVRLCTPSRRPAPRAHFTQRQSSRKAGADHQARWAGAWGGKGCELEVPERRWQGLGVEDAYGRRGQQGARWGPWGGGGGDVDMGQRGRVWRRPGEQERRWRWLGMEVAYGQRGERETRCCSRGGGADMGRRWRAWRRPGERERRWRGLGPEDRYGLWGERRARWGAWKEGGVDMGRRWRAWRLPGERERRWRGLGVEDPYGRRGELDARAALGGRGMWTWDGVGVRGGQWGSGSGGSGVLGGRGGAFGSGSGASERPRRGGAVESESAGVGSPCWWGTEAPPFAGAGLVAGCARPIRRRRQVLEGLAWCRLVLGGGGSPPSIDPLREDATAAVAGGTGRVTVPGGAGPRGPLRRGRGGRGDTIPGTGGRGPWW